MGGVIWPHRTAAMMRQQAVVPRLESDFKPLELQAVMFVELTAAKRVPGPVVAMPMGDTHYDTNSISQCSVYKGSNRFLKNVMCRVMNSIE